MIRKLFEFSSGFWSKYSHEIFIFLLGTVFSAGILAAQVLLKEERKLPLQFISPAPSPSLTPPPPIKPSLTFGVLGQQQKRTVLLNINVASFSQLDQLPGIGAARAQKIIDGRPYSKIEELKTRKILPVSVYEKIKDQITAD